MITRDGTKNYEAKVFTMYNLDGPNRKMWNIVSVCDEISPELTAKGFFRKTAFGWLWSVASFWTLN